MTKRTLAAGMLALALLATPRMASAGVHFSFGIGLPFFGAVVAPAPAVVVPAPAYVLPPAYYPYPYPPVVAYGPPGYYGGSVIVWGHHHRVEGGMGPATGGIGTRPADTKAQYGMAGGCDGALRFGRSRRSVTLVGPQERRP